MLIKGSISGRKTELLTDYYISLLKGGAAPESVLVLVLNSFRKAEFIKRINEKAPELSSIKHNVSSFYGLAYNAFLNNYDFICKSVLNKTRNEPPNLCGLEVSQYIFKESIKTADFSDYISKVNLLHQLFRRYSLIVQNGLSDKEVLERSKILGESFAADAKKAVDAYKIKTFKYNSFDYLRQTAVFPLIYNNTGWFKNIKYLIADDADEFSYAQMQFIDALIPGLKDSVIAYDEKGSSRCGYLCAYKSGVSEFIKKYSPEIKAAEEKSNFTDTADKVYEAVKHGGKIKTGSIFYYSGVKRLDMIYEAAKKIKELIKNGAKEEDIAVITPDTDTMLSECFNSERINFQVMSGNEKLSDDAAVKYIITVLKLINDIKITEYELKNLLIKLLKIPFSACFEIMLKFRNGAVLCPFEFLNEKFNSAYTKLLSYIKAEKQAGNSVSEQIKAVKENLINDFCTEFPAEKYNFLLKEAQGFEAAFKNHLKNPADAFITGIENSIISENPAETALIKPGEIVISTPQKIIDYAYKTKYQLWLDISSGSWIKNDTGTLYNAWVLSKDFNKSTFTLEDNIELTLDKTARVLRKLILCTGHKIMLFSSLYDNQGNENFGGISDFFETEPQKKASFNIIPRNDQKRVLEYKQGKFGITAVPGAGKTTILAALVLKLLNSGIPGRNIFVLTYMESAAKNFKERIKDALPEENELPNISTIHGLALRIIKENGNYAKIGLDEDFEICDDAAKENIIRGLFVKLKIDEEKYDDYFRCISAVKLSASGGGLSSNFKEIQIFCSFYSGYNKYLRSNNLIDYDDMLSYALKILDENLEIRRYYQNLCRYIIEDEAQDSTEVQQRLLEMLSEKHGNLVRCGDINQSVTSTFTNAAPDGFKNFIKQNPSAQMSSSQRCAKSVYTLANEFLKEASKASDAFFDIQMTGTDKNPETDKKPEYIIFETERQEKNFILETVKTIKAENPDASIAVLLRLNTQVNEYCSMFEAENIKTAVLNGSIAQKSIYKIIYAVLKIVQNPFNNNITADFARAAARIYNLPESSIDFIKSLKTPFIKLNPDELHSEALLQLYFDIDYHLNNSNEPPDIFALNTGLYYSRTAADKSNAGIISALVKKLMNNAAGAEELLIKLDYAANKGGYKLFDENDNDAGISIMTMHKAKGSEFDYVFIPYSNEDNYALSLRSAKLKSGSHFVQTIKSLADKTAVKTPDELKKEQINENLRLLYVGITRAKQGLYFTNAQNYLRRKNTKPLELVQKCINNNRTLSQTLPFEGGGLGKG